MKKQSSLSKANKSNSKTNLNSNNISVNPSTNFAIMKYESFLGQYYEQKQMFQINLSSNLIRQFIKQDQNGIIDLGVPYAQSEQVSEQSSFCEIAIVSQKQQHFCANIKQNQNSENSENSENIENNGMQIINSARQIFSKEELAQQIQNKAKPQEDKQTLTQIYNYNQNFTDQQEQYEEKQVEKNKSCQKKAAVCNTKQLTSIQLAQKYQSIRHKQFNIQSTLKQVNFDSDKEQDILSALKQTASFRQQKLKGWNQQICKVSHTLQKKGKQKFQKINDNKKYQQNQNTHNLKNRTQHTNMIKQNYRTQEQSELSQKKFNKQISNKKTPKMIKCKKISLKEQILKKIQLQKHKDTYKLQNKAIKEDRQFLRRFLQ